jgi:hypothetical protein
LRSERACPWISTTVRSAVLTGVGNGKRTSYSVQGLVASPCSALVKNSFGALIMRHYRLPCGSHYQVCNSAPILLTGAGWSLRPLKMDPPRYFYRRGYWCMSTRNEALGQASNLRPSEAKEPSIERGRLRAYGTPTKKPFSLQKKMVPRVGLEPTLLSELDFESSASTNSTTGARSGGRFLNARGEIGNRVMCKRASREYTSYIKSC